MRKDLKREIVVGIVVVVVSIFWLSVFYHCFEREIERLEYTIDIQGVLVHDLAVKYKEVAGDISYLGRYNVPYQYFSILKQESIRHGLDLDFMLGLMWVESRFDPNARSHMDAYGLMQVQWPTALEIDPTLRSYWQLYDAETNIRIGVAYFRKMLDRFGSYDYAAMAYNYGPGRFMELYGRGQHSTRYVDTIRETFE